MTTSDGGTALFALRFFNLSFQRLPIPTSVVRAESKMVASKAIPSFLTTETATKAMLIMQPRTDRKVTGLMVRAVTPGLVLSLEMRSHRTA